METDALESGREVAEGNYVVFGERAFQCEYLSVSGMAAMGTRHISARMPMHTPPVSSMNIWKMPIAHFVYARHTKIFIHLMPNSPKTTWFSSATARRIPRLDVVFKH